MFKKYKKRILRVAVAITFVVMLFALPAMPAFAASDGWTSAVFNSYNEYLSQWGRLYGLQGQKSPGGTGMEWTLPGESPWVGNGLEFFVRANMDVALKTGDRFILEDKTIYGWFGGSENMIISVRFFLGYFEYANNDTTGTPNVIGSIAAGDYTTYNFKGGQSYGLTVKGKEFHITNDYDHVWVGIMFKVNRTAGFANTFSINNLNFHYSYGNPNSPEAPIYKPFDDDTMNELEDAENQVLDGTQGGLDAFKNSINGVYGLLPNYFKPLTAAVSMINVYLGIKSLGDLISISLVFGVMGFLLSGSLVAYAARAARSDNAKHSHNGKAGK